MSTILSVRAYVDAENNAHIRLIFDENITSTRDPNEWFSYRAVNTAIMDSSNYADIPERFLTVEEYNLHGNEVHLFLESPYVLTRINFYGTTTNSVTSTVDVDFYEEYEFPNVNPFYLSSKSDNNSYGYIIWRQSLADEYVSKWQSVYKAKIIKGEKVYQIMRGVGFSTFYSNYAGIVKTHKRGGIAFNQGVKLENGTIGEQYTFICDVDGQVFQDDNIIFNGVDFLKEEDPTRRWEYSPSFVLLR